MRRALRKMTAWGAACALSLACSPQASACAACFGRSDSQLSKGMNWGIFSLMLFIVSVLSGIACCFVCLARRAAAYDAASENSQVEFELIKSGNS